MKKLRFDSFTITSREIIASIVIVSLLLIFGLSISNVINQFQLDRNEVYNKAIKIENASMFEYGMRTSVGSAFVYGDISAVDPVTFSELSDSYMYVEKVKERYTEHTRQVAHTETVNGKTHTYYTTETYWTWDRVSTESLHSTQIQFNNTVFDYTKIDCKQNNYITTIQESSKIRYKYYGTAAFLSGTIFTELKNNTISDHSKFFQDMHTEDAYKAAVSWSWIPAFWVGWVILIVIAVFAFYYIDNRWLY